MAKIKSAYVCNDCGADFVRWQGQCSECGAWNTISEVRLPSRDKTSNVLAVMPVRLLPK